MEKIYETRNLLSADANGTRIIRGKGSGDGEFGYMLVIADSAHTIGFYDGDPATDGVLIFTKPASFAVGFYPIRRAITKGLYAVVAASFAGNIVIGYK